MGAQQSIRGKGTIDLELCPLPPSFQGHYSLTPTMTKGYCLFYGDLFYMGFPFWVMVSSPLVPLGLEMVTAGPLLALGYCAYPYGSPQLSWETLTKTVIMD